MAAEAAVGSAGLPLCPSFAVVCCFLERYGPALDLPEMSFPQMESYLRDTSTVPRPLVELHVKLLRKLGKMVSSDRWEKNLAKVCQELNSTWAWELEQRGYQEMTMECKSGILKYLCECQFDDNLKFKLTVNDEEPERMRMQPIGRDHRGHLYWLQLDQEHNIRLYTEEQDDPHGATWRCIVRSRKDLVDALKLLKAQVDPILVPRAPHHSPSLEEDHSSAEMKQSDGEWPVLLKEEPADKHDFQQECPKTEETAERSLEMDNHVHTITAVTEESRASLQIPNTVSVLRAPATRNQEASAGSVRSSQQATIPLKKRELKLPQDYHSNHRSNTSSIIVLNPSVIHRSEADSLLPNQVSHVGVICSPSQQQSIQCPHEQKVVRRESVLVHKTGAQEVEINSQSPTSKKKKADTTRDTWSIKEDRNVSTGALGKTKEATQSAPDPVEDTTELNGTPASDKLKEEASSELQREGIRLKIKIPPQRKEKLRAISVKAQQKIGEAEEQPRLRRSARICRPSSKAAESQRKKLGRSKGLRHIPVEAVQTKKRRGRPKWSTVRSKRHRVKQEDHEEEQPVKQPEGEGEFSTADACTHCGQATHPELILLCDLCDCGYHTACLRPPLMLVPDGEWFCPPCQHKQLCERLEEQLSNLDSALKKQELAERRRERLVYVGISVENILPEGDKEKSPKKKDVRRSRLGRRSTRARKHISYRFDDFDDAINEAIEDNRNLSGSVSHEGNEVQQPITGHTAKRTEIQRSIRWPAGCVRKKRKRRLNDLESDSTAADSEEEYRLSHSSEEEEELIGWGAEDEADSELCSGDSLSGDRPLRRPPRLTVGRPRGRPRLEDSPYPREWDSLSDSAEESSRRALRRGLTQQVNYCESSSSDSGHTATLKTANKRQELVSSDYSDVSAFSRESEEECTKEEPSKRKQTRVRHKTRVKQKLSPPRPRRSRQTDVSPPSSEDNQTLCRRPNRRQDSDEEQRHSTGRTPTTPGGGHDSRQHRTPQS